MANEDAPQTMPEGGEPDPPIALPPELVDFLTGQDIACVMQATDRGTAFVIKLPNAEIQSVRGTVPIALRHELYHHPSAPVIRTVISIFDQPDSHLALETFTNIADDQQKADFVALAEQDELYLLFYDEQVHHRLSKQVGHGTKEAIPEILGAAGRILQSMPDERFDFDRAKVAVMEHTGL